MAFMTAGDVKLADPLKELTSGYGKTAQGGLSDALGRITNQAKKSQIASGRVQGDYMGQALGRSNSLASQKINNTLGGVLGGVSLKDLQSQQEFERQMALAQEIGDLNSPSTLQEVLGGLGGGADLALQGKGLYDALGRGKGGGSYRGASPSLDVYDPYSIGYARYQ